MPIFLQENQILNKKTFKLPKNLKKHLEDVLMQYGQYTQNPGYKRAKSLVDSQYNKRNDKESKNDREISYTDLKRIDYDMRHMDQSPDNINFTLNGGREMANFARNTLNHERTKVEPVLKQEKVKTRNKNSLKPTATSTKPIQLNNSVAKIHESVDNHRYLNYLNNEASAYSIFDMFENNENPWLPLINPQMYQKALQEFTKYGQLIHFPVQKIYQWMGIIMKNTAILRTTTDICGHSSYFPTDEFVDYYFEGDYDLWNEYKENINQDNDYYAAWEFLDEKGFDEWNKLPDGSDSLSDFGIEPLENLISQYNSDMSPEQVLVLINKCLDIAHFRGDLASMFIQGGSQVLTQISENIQKNKHIIITENQLKKLKNYL